MIREIDLVMWTKNGAKTLPRVLRQINKVIPNNIVNKKIIIDDNSSDATREIATSFGWQVISNRGNGISDGANTALEHVSAEYFVSFEQDLLLADDWWAKVPVHLSSARVAAASGIRLPSEPADLRKTIEYAMERYQEKTGDADSFFIGKTLDNTIYRTQIIKEIGGFPKLPIPAGIDNVLAQRFDRQGFIWKVDYSVKSVHLRSGVQDELRHDYWYGTCFNILIPLLSKKNVDVKPMILRILFSPIRGLEIAFKKKAPGAVVIYPLTRISLFRGVVAGRKAQTKSL